MIPEERDCHKLKLPQVRNAIGIPLKQQMGVLMVFNSSDDVTVEQAKEHVKGVSTMVSGVMESVDSLQEVFLDTDILSAAFNLVQDGLLTLNVSQVVTKANRSAA
jgi:PAS domain-containing protein